MNLRRPWDGLSITTVTLTDTSVPTPVSSVLSPEPGTSRMQPKKDTRGGSDKYYKKKWQHNEENNSKNLININNEPLFKSTVYVCNSNSVFPTPLNLRHNDADIDSGCTTHTWPLTAPVQNIKKTAPSAAININLPNDQIMAQSHHGTVPIPDMHSSAHQVKIFLEHTYKPLLSLGQLADVGYTFQGDHKHMILTHPSHQSLCATRCPS